jgi:hypothetical protein
MEGHDCIPVFARRPAVSLAGLYPDRLRGSAGAIRFADRFSGWGYLTRGAYITHTL